MSIKTTLEEWKEAPRYSQIKKDMLSDKSDLELIALRDKCINSRKYQQYIRVYLWFYASIFIAVVGGVGSWLEEDSTILFLCAGWIVLFSLVIWIHDGPQEGIIKTIDEILKERYEGWN